MKKKVVQAEVEKRIANRQLSEKEITQIEKQVKEDPNQWMIFQQQKQLKKHSVKY